MKRCCFSIAQQNFQWCVLFPRQNIANNGNRGTFEKRTQLVLKAVVVTTTTVVVSSVAISTTTIVLFLLLFFANPIRKLAFLAMCRLWFPWPVVSSRSTLVFRWWITTQMLDRSHIGWIFQGVPYPLVIHDLFALTQMDGGGCRLNNGGSSGCM